MSISFVQEGFGTSGGASSLVFAYPSNVVQGNLLLCSVVNTSPGTTCAVTDTQGNTWTAAAARFFVAGIGGLQIFWAIAKSSAACTVTATMTGGNGEGIEIREYSSTVGWPANPVDITANAGQTTNNTPQVSITTTKTNDLLYSFSINTGIIVYTAGAGYTNLDTSTNAGAGYGYGWDDKLNVAAGTYTGQFGLGSSQTWIIQCAAFYETTAAAADNLDWNKQREYWIENPDDGVLERVN
jgi:hypothetical protein